MAEQYLKKNKKQIVIDTPTGPRAFSGMSKTWHEKTIKIFLSDRFFHVGCKHVFLTEDGWKYADHIKIGDGLVSENNSVSPVITIQDMPGEFMYDLLDVDGGSAYIANGFIHHNCEFLSSDAMLISSMKLAKLEGKMVLHEDMGFKFWAPPEQIGGQGKTYLVSLDPATGGGKDFSVIEVFDFPGLNQVAEWRSNEINIPLLYAKLKWILNKLTASQGRGRAEVLWTFERNGIGEAVAVLYMNDERPPEFADLYNDVHGKYGVYTSGKTKVLACLQLKALIEKITNGMKINSEILLFELKNFIAKGGSYEGKSGATDDCVMACVGIARLIKRLADYNDEAFKQVNEYVDPSVETITDSGEGPEWDDAMPMGIL